MRPGAGNGERGGALGHHMAKSVLRIDHDLRAGIGHDLAFGGRRNRTGQNAIEVHRKQHGSMRTEAFDVGIDQGCRDNARMRLRRAGRDQQPGREIDVVDGRDGHGAGHRNHARCVVNAHPARRRTMMASPDNAGRHRSR